jgi:single-strand DNA-binding protein
MMTEERKEYSYARVELKGRLGSDLDLRYTPTGKAMASANVAIKKMVKGETSTEWYRVVVWGDKAEELAGQDFRKGQTVIVRGNLSLNEWKGQDGEVRRQLQVSVTEISKEA